MQEGISIALVYSNIFVKLLIPIYIKTFFFWFDRKNDILSKKNKIKLVFIECTQREKRKTNFFCYIYY